MTLELDSFLKKLIALPGLSGYEGPVSEVIAEAWRPLVDQLTTSRLGSLQGLRRGQALEPRPRLLLAAHMDAIGLMVSGIRDGLLRITEIGGIDARILPGQAVTVFGRRPLPGEIVQPPDHLLPPECKDKPVEMLICSWIPVAAEEVETLVLPETWWPLPSRHWSWEATIWLATVWITAPRWPP